MGPFKVHEDEIAGFMHLERLEDTCWILLRVVVRELSKSCNATKAFAAGNHQRRVALVLDPTRHACERRARGLSGIWYSGRPRRAARGPMGTDRCGGVDVEGSAS